MIIDLILDRKDNEQFDGVDTYKFEYMLLDRCKQDCEYYLGNGNKQNKYLWAGNPKDHIKKMVELFRSVPESPEWLTIEQIKDYAERMGV